MTCDVDGCRRDRVAKYWCNKHFMRWFRHGDPTTLLVVQPQPPKCEVPGCLRKARSRGWCRAHYQRWLDAGGTSPDVPLGDMCRCGCRRRRDLCGVETCDWCGEPECGCCEACGGQSDIPGVTVWCRICFYRVTNEQRAARRAS